MKQTWRVWGTAAASLAMLELAVLGQGCGGSSAGGKPPDGSVVASTPELNVSGGGASSPGGQGQAGGVVHLLAGGDITVDSSTQPTPPMVAPAPAGTMAIDDAALAADVNASGTAVISGNVTAGGSDGTRTISVNGDLYVTGTLRSADLGGSRQGLDLKATGTIYVTGTVDASGAAGGGQAGGAINLSANQIVVTGKLLSSGGDGTTAGGAAGAITIASMGDVALAGTIRLRGGAASDTSAGAAQGGAAAPLTVDAKGAVDIGATIDARGGAASSKVTGTVAGGAAGAVRIGEHAEPTSIIVRVPVVAKGGSGDTAGGPGGSFTAEPDTGSINVNGAGAIDVSGGDAANAPGAGGLITGSARKDPGAGGLHIAGEITANGGSVTKGGAGNGADGGHVDFELIPTDGAVLVDASAKITVNGGSAGSGVAGGGGHVWMFTKDGDLTIAGTVNTKGGSADGTGGLGGMIYFFTDNNHNAIDVAKGNLLIDTTGVLDSSGGDGAIGGSARNDGMGNGSVAPFPEEQEKFAIFLNCDGAHGETLNWMQNNGHLIARGGVHNGNGGDITYHGIGPGQLDMTAPDGNHHPPSGNVDMAGDGTGMPGDYGGE
jgi:hypothetical protein